MNVYIAVVRGNGADGPYEDDREIEAESILEARKAMTRLLGIGEHIVRIGFDRRA